MKHAYQMRLLLQSLLQSLIKIVIKMKSLLPNFLVRPAARRNFFLWPMGSKRLDSTAPEYHHSRYCSIEHSVSFEGLWCISYSCSVLTGCLSHCCIVCAPICSYSWNCLLHPSAIRTRSLAYKSSHSSPSLTSLE